MSGTSSSSNGSSFVPEGPAWNLNDPSKIFGRDKELKLLSDLMEQQQESSRTKTKKNNIASIQEDNEEETQPQDAANQESKAADDNDAPPDVSTATQDPPSRPQHTSVLLHGVAGSGKSTLVRSLQRQESASSNEWVLCVGKFEEHRRHEPFSALVEAVNELVDVWIHHNSLAQVCQMSGLRSLLEEDSEFLQNLFPQMYHAITSSNTCMASVGADKKNLRMSMAHRLRSSFTLKQDLTTVDRLNASFKRLLNFLSSTPAAANHPVVLFIDDVHWADGASLKVIETLASCDQMNPSLFMIFSYRDEEVTAEDHPLNTTMKAIKDNIAAHEARADEVNVMPKLVDIPVADLPVESVNSLLASLVQKEEDETLPLAQVVHNKTHGNPFFVAQCFLMLRQQQFLRYSYASFGWEWGNVEQLANMAQVTDNVADMIAHTITTQLPETTRVALKVASCLGKIIPLNILLRWFANYYSKENDGTTCSLSLRQIHIDGLQSVLDNAVQLGILICAADSGVSHLGQSKSEASAAYMWAHDKLQSVAYDLIPEDRRAKLHIDLGRLLWTMSKEDEEEEWMVFMAAEQMNRYSAFQDQEGKDSGPLGAEVAELCLEAAQLSLSKSALYPAYDMLQASMKHLQVGEFWKEHYDLSLRLYSTVAELSVQLGKKDEALAATKQVLDNATSHVDKFRVQLVELKRLTSGNDRNYRAGFDRAIEILKDYGVRMPARLLPGQMMIECRRIRRLFPGYKLDGMMEMSLMEHGAVERNIMKLLIHLSMLGLISEGVNKNVSWYAAMKVVSLTAEKGVCEESALGVAMLAGGVRTEGHYSDANEYADVALKLIERFPQTVGSVHAAVIGMVAGGVYSATKPINKSLDLWMEGHHVALRTGNTEKAGSSIQAYTFTYFAVGLPLPPLKADLVEYEKEAIQFGLPATVMAIFSIFRQFIENLQNRSLENPTRLTGDVMDQDKLLQRFSGNGLRMTKRDLNTFRLCLANLFGDLDTMEEMIGELEQFIDNDHFVVRSGLRLLSLGLAAFRLSRVNGKRKFRQLAKRIKKKIQGLLKLGNVNLLPFFQMFEAEEAPSKERYDNAIRSCARLGLIHFEAYMCERAAVWFLEEQNDSEWAEFYMEQAFSLYGDWGATGKSWQLKQNYPRLLRSASLRERANAALKGRTRYSSSHTDMLADFDWDRLSTSTITKSSGSKSSIDDKDSGLDMTEAPTEDSSSDGGSVNDSLRGSGTLSNSILRMFGSPLS